MSIYALDTNIVSYFLRDNEVVMKAISNLIENRHSITIPPVVYYEVRRWLMSSNAAKMKPKIVEEAEEAERLRLEEEERLRMEIEENNKKKRVVVVKRK
jgi:predicted nucleic acid-binding protein